MSHHEMFSKKSDLAFSSQNQTLEEVGSDGEEEEEAPEQKGFRDEVDLCLGAMMKLT